LETVAYLNDQVLAQPCQAYVTTRDPGKVAARFPHLFGRSDLILLECDVRTFRPVPVPLNFIIHAASPADVGVFMQDPFGNMETIVDGTKTVLTVAAEAGVEALLFISSGAVYGHQPADQPWLSEEYAGGPDLRNPRGCYGEAKRYAEMLCRIYREERGLPVSIARLFALVGPYQDLNSTSAIIDFIRQGLEGSTIRIRDDGQAVRSYCYIADAVVALWKILLSPQQGETMNVGCDLEALSFLDLAHRIRRCVGKPVSVVAEGAPASGILGRRYAPDVTRLHEKTGFRPTTSLDQALSRTIAWMKERQAARVTAD
jgi:dTDP-glucose 4,6-dehydratase